MKKIFLTIALAAALTSCTKSHEDSSKCGYVVSNVYDNGISRLSIWYDTGRTKEVTVSGHYTSDKYCN